MIHHAVRKLILIILALIMPATPLHASVNTEWNTWSAKNGNSLVLIKGNQNVWTPVSGKSSYDLIEQVCSICSANGIKIVMLGDLSTSHDLRTWLLTKGTALYQSDRNCIIVPGFTWKGNADEPAISIFGSRGFATNGESDSTPPSVMKPFVENATLASILQETYLYDVSHGNFAFSSGKDQDLHNLLYVDSSSCKCILTRWNTIAAETEPPDYRMSTRKLLCMDTLFQAKDVEWGSRYRALEKKKLTDLNSWIAQDDGGSKEGKICQFSLPFPSDADVSYYGTKKSANSALYELTALCDATTFDTQGKVSLTDSNYRKVLGGGWKVAPSFCTSFNDLSTNMNKGYSGIWLGESTLNAVSASSLAASSSSGSLATGADDTAKDGLKAVHEDLKAGRHTYVSSLCLSDQDSSLKLSIKDPSGSLLGVMGDTVLTSGPARFELNVNYQYNTPRDLMMLESASLVVVYRSAASGTAITSREISFSGIHNAIRNYLYTTHNGKELKNRTFFRNLEDLSNIRCVYGMATYSRPDISESKDYYRTKKGGGAGSYKAFTSPVWFQD